MSKGSVEYINPDGLVKNFAFTQMVVVSGPVKTIYIGAQNSVDGETESFIGEGDLAAQTEQTLKNIDLCLKRAGAKKEHIISWNIWIKDGQDISPAFEVGMRWLGHGTSAPLNNVMMVAGFPNPKFLVSVDAVAVLPEES
jgi:enamine deaminase RidA (YjgF/YER057c/UK114 family)